MTTMASQITSLTVVYSTVYSDADQRKHQSSASLAFVWGIHRDRWIPRTKGQLRGKCLHLMTSSCDVLIYPRLCQYGAEGVFPWGIFVIFSVCASIYAHYCHYGCVIMSAMASQITGISIVYTTVCLFRRRSKETPKLPVTGLCGGMHRWPVNSSHQRPVTRKIFPFDDVIIVPYGIDCWLDSWYLDKFHGGWIYQKVKIVVTKQCLQMK